MLDRLNFLVVYVGSAAMVAFLAACLSSPQVATYRCDATGTDSAPRCQLANTLAASVPETEVKSRDKRSPDDMSWEAVAMAAQH